MSPSFAACGRFRSGVASGAALGSGEITDRTDAVHLDGGVDRNIAMVAGVVLDPDLNVWTKYLEGAPTGSADQVVMACPATTTEQCSAILAHDRLQPSRGNESGESSQDIREVRVGAVVYKLLVKLVGAAEPVEVGRQSHGEGGGVDMGRTIAAAAVNL